MTSLMRRRLSTSYSVSRVHGKPCQPQGVLGNHALMHLWTHMGFHYIPHLEYGSLPKPMVHQPSFIGQEGTPPKSTKNNQNHHHQANNVLEIAGSPLRKPENKGFGHPAIWIRRVLGHPFRFSKWTHRVFGAIHCNCPCEFIELGRSNDIFYMNS